MRKFLKLSVFLVFDCIREVIRLIISVPLQMSHKRSASSQCSEALAAARAIEK